MSDVKRYVSDRDGMMCDDDGIEAPLEVQSGLFVAEADYERLCTELTNIKLALIGHGKAASEVLYERDSALASCAALRVDAERYRWLKTRINWHEAAEYPMVGGTSLSVVGKKHREWTHRDYRSSPPASESIDEYIDGELMRHADQRGESPK